MKNKEPRIISTQEELIYIVNQLPPVPEEMIIQSLIVNEAPTPWCVRVINYHPEERLNIIKSESEKKDGQG